MKPFFLRISNYKNNNKISFNSELYSSKKINEHDNKSSVEDEYNIIIGTRKRPT